MTKREEQPYNNIIQVNIQLKMNNNNMTNLSINQMFMKKNMNLMAIFIQADYIPLFLIYFFCFGEFIFILIDDFDNILPTNAEIVTL